MKVLELRFKNLNSLYGEWHIDFTDPRYLANGIFALTGPTGAGKSTILDAICLALYGATPRLGKITKSSNEIMSRQTGECYAEVLFESRTGQYRCHWEQRRARKKADGKLQEQEHQISEESTGKPLETKKSLVIRVVEEKTGMDFDRFTRSILLAQGEFDTFLKADIEQKSKILEQITGTKIYTRISQKVHERYKEEGERLALLRAEIAGIGLLETEQENEIQKALAVKEKEEVELNSKIAEMNRGITWLTTIDGLKKELALLSGKAVRLETAEEEFKPQRRQLQWAEKAACLEGGFATVSALRKQQTEDRGRLINEQNALPGLEASVRDFSKKRELAEQETAGRKKELQSALPLLHRIRFLDQKRIEQQKIILKSKEELRKAGQKTARDRTNLSKAEVLRQEGEQELADIKNYLGANAKDEWLVSGLAGLEEQLKTLEAQERELQQKKRELQEGENRYQQMVRRLAVYKKKSGQYAAELRKNSAEQEQARGKLQHLLAGKLLREYRTEKETLFREMAFVQHIARLEEQRKKLEEGKPCPLCGATEHPFAAGTVFTPDATEKRIEELGRLIEKAEGLENSIRKLEAHAADITRKIADSEKQEEARVHEQKIEEAQIALLRRDVQRADRSLREYREELYAKFCNLGFSECRENTLAACGALLKKRQQLWLEMVSKKTDTEQSLARLDGELKRLGELVKTGELALTEKREDLALLEKECDACAAERRELFGDKDTEEEERRLHHAVAAAEKEEKKACELQTEMLQEQSRLKASIDSLRKQIVSRTPELEHEDCAFSAALAENGFADEKHFLSLRMTTQERNALSKRAKELDTARAELEIKQKDRQTRLLEESSKEITDKPLDELEALVKEYNESLKEMRNIVAGYKYTLDENRAARERIKEKQTAIEQQKKEYLRWEKLYGLIGSADGKKYRNFAQGLTFELMIAHANRQLEKMTDRYLLIHSTEHPLELNVVDNYQAGEVRTVKNLSGGESFIVSLTLALGLSNMASRSVRVDSLFLDEGFGTLDEEVLEIALETLSRLHQDGKLIGVISHVSAMKERIGTQIVITPGLGGKSSLSGPGCRRVGYNGRM